MRDFVYSCWRFIFDHEYSPLRHIPDVGIRHMVLQLLCWMWATVFGISIGSYFVFVVTLVFHTLFVSAAALIASLSDAVRWNPGFASAASAAALTAGSFAGLDNC